MRQMAFFALCAACLALAFSADGAPKGFPGKKKKGGDTADVIRKILPAGWTIQKGDSGPPLLWQSNMTCKVFQLNNLTVTHHHPLGNFDYHPAHTFWLCPPGFVGSQFTIGMVEQRYPAIYIADGPTGILFHYSMGDNDWGAAPDDVIRTLRLEKAKENPAFCKNVINALSYVKLPKGMAITCQGMTASSIILSIGTGKDISIEDMNKITDEIARLLKNTFPDKARVVFHRGYGMGFDAQVVGFKADFR